MFYEGGSTEVELPLAYYTFHGRGSGQDGGVNIVGKEVIQEERELFTLPRRMGGLNIALPQDLHKNLEQSIELSIPMA